MASSPGTYLRHIHLPSDVFSASYPAYAVASAIQARLVRLQLDFKSAAASWDRSQPQPQPPPPTLVTFTPSPTYTLGRRLSQALRAGVDIAPLKLELLVRRAPRTSEVDLLHLQGGDVRPFAPAIFRSERGGLTTYHGPGQLVAWPVIDLRGGGGWGGGSSSSSSSDGQDPITASAAGGRRHRPFGVRDYACLLERTTISVLRDAFGLRGFTTEDPGVWVAPPGRPAAEARKVAALGVHLRRHVSALGVALNLTTAVTSSPSSSSSTSSSSSAPPGTPSSSWREILPPPYKVHEETARLLDTLGLQVLTNPWTRFVPCGLEGKYVTSAAEELKLAAIAAASGGGGGGGGGGSSGFSPAAGLLQLESADPGRGVGAAWAAEFARRLGVDEVREVPLEMVRGLMEETEREAAESENLGNASPAL